MWYSTLVVHCQESSHSSQATMISIKGKRFSLEGTVKSGMRIVQLPLSGG